MVSEKIMPLIIGPSVCPISIIMPSKPKEVPSKFEVTISHAKGDVDEITAEKPIPYPTERRSRIGK